MRLVAFTFLAPITLKRLREFVEKTRDMKPDTEVIFRETPGYLEAKEEKNDSK